MTDYMCRCVRMHFTFPLATEFAGELYFYRHINCLLFVFIIVHVRLSEYTQQILLLFFCTTIALIFLRLTLCVVFRFHKVIYHTFTPFDNRNRLLANHHHWAWCDAAKIRYLLHSGKHSHIKWTLVRFGWCSPTPVHCYIFHFIIHSYIRAQHMFKLCAQVYIHVLCNIR